ncbi:hypothetical protein GVX86_09410 [[Haemophilus] felis]|nr:hypothetical protein [[Haemophilus] felis]NBI42186.1 hypothetical protein [[Haemophilus] felis]
MAIYLLYAHISCAFLSLGLFLLRGLMQLRGKHWRNIKLLKILPHISDSILLFTGIGMLILVEYGFPTWLIAKFVLLISYIVFAKLFLSKNSNNRNPIYFYVALASLLSVFVIAYW